ncbi:MAG: peptidoglycan-binding protein [Phormidesmis sp.]
MAVESTAAMLPGSARSQTTPALSAQRLIAQASGSAAAISPVTTALGVGSRGSAVEVLQRRLQRNGYYGGRIDGIYGLATQRAVSAFQTEVAIEPTGRLDENTWRQLQSSAAPKQPDALLSESTGENVPAETASPVVAQLPAIETDEAAGDEALEENSGAAVPTDGSGSLGKIFGLSLGLVALIASFGVGFFIANRSKAEADSDADWRRSGPEPKIGGLPYEDTQTISPNGLGTRGNNAGRPVANLATISAESSPVTANGQMGEAMPLAQTDIIDGLISELRTPDPTRRRKAIWELGQRGNSLAMQPLVEAMAEADSKEKSLVLAALSEIGIRSMKPLNRALAIALRDENPEVRKNAIRDLTRVYDLVIQISQMLDYATEDEDLEVRQTASWALDQLNRIRRSQDIDANMRSLPTGGTAPIDLLSSEASIRRSSQPQQ